MANTQNSSGRTLRAKAATKPRKRRTALPRDIWGPMFIQDYGRTFSLTQSAENVGISIDTVFKRKREDPVFAAELEAAKDVTRELLKAEIVRRATVGDVEETPYYFKGENDEDGYPKVLLAGTKSVRKVSDTLLTLAAKALMPELFGDRVTLYNVDLTAEIEKAAADQNVPANVVRQEVIEMARRQMAEQKDEERKGIFPYTGMANRKKG